MLQYPSCGESIIVLKCVWMQCVISYYEWCAIKIWIWCMRINASNKILEFSSSAMYIHIRIRIRFGPSHSNLYLKFPQQFWFVVFYDGFSARIHMYLLILLRWPTADIRPWWQQTALCEDIVMPRYCWLSPKGGYCEFVSFLSLN